MHCSGPEELNFEVNELPNTLRSMAKTRTQMSHVLDDQYAAAAQQELNVDTHAMAKTRTKVPDCLGGTVHSSGPERAERRCTRSYQHALVHGQDSHADA